MEKMFPTLLIIIDGFASAVYLYQGDIRKSIYWIAAMILTITVTY